MKSVWLQIALTKGAGRDGAGLRSRGAPLAAGRRHLRTSADPFVSLAAV